MPLIRYRSHDIASIRKGPCKCGANLATISHVKRRKEAVVEYEGVELYPTLFDNAVFSHDHVIDYELYLNSKHGTMRFEVECIDAPEGYEDRIQESLSTHPALNALRVEVKLLPLHALLPGAHFKKMIHMEE